MNSAPSHPELLAIARAMRRSVVDDDTRQVHVLLSRLRTSLVHHLHAEQEPASESAAPADIVVRTGQQRLLELLNDVIFDAGTDQPGCSCLVRAAEIELALRRQARLEATVLDRRSLAGSEGG